MVDFLSSHLFELPVTWVLPFAFATFEIEKVHFTSGLVLAGKQNNERQSIHGCVDNNRGQAVNAMRPLSLLNANMHVDAAQLQARVSKVTHEASAYHAFQFFGSGALRASRAMYRRSGSSSGSISRTSFAYASISEQTTDKGHDLWKQNE